MRVNEMFGAALVATFAIFHGYAHANETSALQIPFAAGFSVATMCLSFLGAAIGARFICRESSATAVAGSLTGASGAVLLLAI